MALELGKKNKMPIGTRDAVHVPIVLVRALNNFNGGDSAVFTGAACNEIRSPQVGEVSHCIIDPFSGPIKTNQTVCVLLMPGQYQHFLNLPY